ncbi:hypothetical protein OG900_23255 [Streptomyces sp. NBC_00433]
MPPRGEWRGLAVQRLTFGTPELISAPEAFAAGLGTWQNPSLSGELGHAVTPTAPAGLISGVAEVAPPVAPPLDPAVTSFAPRAAPTPVRPSAPEPRLTAARLVDLDLPVRALVPVTASVPEAPEEAPQGPEPAASPPESVVVGPAAGPEVLPVAVGPAAEPQAAPVQRSVVAPLVGGSPPLRPGGEAPTSAPSPPPAPSPAPDSSPAPARPLGLGAPLPSAPPVVQRVRPEGPTPRPGFVGEPLSAVPPTAAAAPEAPGGDVSPPLPGEVVAPLVGDAVLLVQRQVAKGAEAVEPVPFSDGGAVAGPVRAFASAPGGDVPPLPSGGVVAPPVQRQVVEGGTAYPSPTDGRVDAPGGDLPPPANGEVVAPLVGDAVPLVQRPAVGGGMPVLPAPGSRADAPGGDMAPLVQRLVPDAGPGPAVGAPVSRPAVDGRAALPLAPGGPAVRSVQSAAVPSAAPPVTVPPAAEPVAGEADAGPPTVQRVGLLGERGLELRAAPTPREPERRAEEPPVVPVVWKRPGQPAQPAGGSADAPVQRLAEEPATVPHFVPAAQGPGAVPLVQPVGTSGPGAASVAQRLGMPGPGAATVAQRVGPPTVPGRASGAGSVAPPAAHGSLPFVQRLGGQTVTPPAAARTAGAGDLAVAAGIASRGADGSYVFAPPPAPAPTVQREPDPPAPEAVPAPAPAPQPPEAAPATTAAPAAPQAPPENTDELVRRLLAPLTRLLRAELRLDRERAGMRLDSRH